MKARISSVVMLIVLSMAFVTMAFAPMVSARLQDGGVELTESQLVVIGLVASAVLWIVRVLASRGYQFSREAVAIVLYVISFFLAIGFTPIVFPPFPPFTDAPSFIGALLAYAGLLLAIASPVAGMAYLIYNVLLKRVLESLFPAAVGKV